MFPGTISGRGSDPLPENAKELLAAFEQGHVAPEDDSPPLPETPPVVAPPEGTPSPAPQEAPPPASGPPAEPEWRKALEAVSEDELFRDPKFSGRFGAAVQKVAKREADRLIRQQEDQRRAAEDRRLMDSDPGAYVAAVRQREADGARAQEIYAPLYAAFAEEEPEVRKLVEQNDYRGRGTPGEQAKLFFQDLVAARTQVERERAKKESDTAFAKRVKEIEAATREKVLSELNGAEPPVDTGGPAWTPQTRPSPAQIEAMSKADYLRLGKTPAERVAAAFGQRRGD